jgi:serine protease
MFSTPGSSHIGYDFVSDPAMSNDWDCRDNDPIDPGDTDAQMWPTPSWHGTYVSSVLPSRRFSKFSGIAYNSSIFRVRLFAPGRCRTGHASDVADAIVWAVGDTIDGLQVNRACSSCSSIKICGKCWSCRCLEKGVDQ